jgi:hypothetical protein
MKRINNKNKGKKKRNTRGKMDRSDKNRKA